MKHLYPTYYHEFHCIAAACPDSCCQGWDVVIDSDTEAFYRTVQGELGKKLREALYTDDDGDRVFRLADQKKCPFWGDDKLCDLYRELGEEHLCATCAQFPRIRMEYADFTEHTLALACPEAARLILASDNTYTDFRGIKANDCEDYNAEVMRILLDARDRAAELLIQKKPLSERFDQLMTFALDTQKSLTGDAPEIDTITPEIFAELEYIDEANRGWIADAAQKRPDLSRHEKELTNLALYWLYRYFLGAIDNLDVMAVIRFLITSVGIVANMVEDDGDIITAAQTYSKEIEQSYENMEALWEAFGCY